MQWNTHSHLHGKHAFLSASKYSWLRYTDDKLIETLDKSISAAQGTRLHNLAAELISLGQKLPAGRSSSKTLNAYVNDAIGYKMTPEQVLFYSDNVFGTADAISFKDKTLRIFDLKNGVSPANMDQLTIYAALFCLEYGIKPGEITFDLRIYQNDEVLVDAPETVTIIKIMDKIVHFDKIIRKKKEEALA